MDPMWGVIYGLLLGGLVLELSRLARGHRIKKESKGYAVTSIVFGLMLFIPLLSIPGLVLGIISFRKTEWKKLSLAGITLCSIASLFYALLLLGRYAR